MQETVMEVVCAHNWSEWIDTSTKEIMAYECRICRAKRKGNEADPRVVIGRVEEVVRERAKWPNE